MDSEFFNVYVKKLKDLSVDLIEKNLLLQTQVEIQAKLINELKASLEDANKQPAIQKNSDPQLLDTPHQDF